MRRGRGAFRSAELDGAPVVQGQEAEDLDRLRKGGAALRADAAQAHIDDIEVLNGAVSSVGLLPDRSPELARQRGRYVLENDEHVDVLVARAAPTADTGERVAFDDVWGRRTAVPYDERLTIAVPTIEDLVRTKRWRLRQKDIADIQLLQALLASTRAKS